MEENLHLASIGDYALHLKKLDPYIGNLPLEKVHLGTLQAFFEAQRQRGIKTKSINLALDVVPLSRHLSLQLR